MVTSTVHDPVRRAEQDHARRPERSRRLGTAAALAVSLVAAAAWMATAVRAVRHGFDITDEGFYLLSYRWWNLEHRSFTGAQYLYGPVFQLLGHDIAALRLFRLATVAGTHLLFGWAVMRWLRPRRPAAPATRLWEAAGTAAVVAAGGAVYGWLPQSPGYNDVALLGGMLAVALVLHAATAAARGRRVPGWPALAFGLLTMPVLLAKWTAAPLLLVIAGTAAVLLRPAGWRAVGRCAAWAAAGAAVALAVVHVLLVPLPTALSELVAVNTLLSERGRSLAILAASYWGNSTPAFGAVAAQHGLLLLAVVAAAAARGRIARRPAPVALVAGAGVSAWHAVRHGGLGGGRLHLFAYVGTLLAVLVFALVVALAVVLVERLRRPVVRSSLTGEGGRGWTVVGLLVLLPVLQALGTNNPPLVNIVNGFGVWLAVLVIVLTGIERAPVDLRVLTAGVAAAAVLAAAGIAVGGLWWHPYRAAGNDRATAHVPDVPALASLRLDPTAAAEYAALRRAVAGHLRPGRPVMGFDTMAGLVLVLDGRPVGEAWYPARDPVRTAAGIESECRGKPLTGNRTPILLFNRPVRPAEVRVLRRCRLDLATDFRLVQAPGLTPGLSVYVPVAEPVGVPAGRR